MKKKMLKYFSMMLHSPIKYVDLDTLAVDSSKHNIRELSSFFEICRLYSTLLK